MSPNTRFFDLPKILSSLVFAVFAVSANAATITGELIVTAGQGYAVEDGSGNVIGVDFTTFGFPANPNPLFADLDAAGADGSPFLPSFVASGGFISLFNQVPGSNADFYDFTQAGSLEANNTLFSWNDFELAIDGPIGISFPTPAGGLVPVDYNGQGILTSAGGLFDATYATYTVALDGAGGASLHIIASGVGVPGGEVPVPAAAWLFGSALAGLALRRRSRQ